MKTSKNKEIHEPVLVDEVVKYLHIKNQAQYIDATVGAGGHAIEIVKNGGIVLGIDFDPSMLDIARRKLEDFCKSDACPTPNCEVQGQCFKLVRGNFTEIDEIAQENGYEGVAGIIFDLGVSSVHFRALQRGFSFQNDSAPLDMRLDPSLQGVTASDLINVLRKDQLQSLFEVVMTKAKSKLLASLILERRSKDKFKTVGDLLEVVELLEKREMKGKKRVKLHPATNVFLALRIAVNNELGSLREALPKAFGLLGKGGKLLVISFHSGEDRIVKNFFRGKKEKSEAEIETKKPVVPGEEEVRNNPSSRSARMRVLRKN